jgi:hypothetical protein
MTYDQFTYIPETKTWVAEASDLRWPSGGRLQSFVVDDVQVLFVRTDTDPEGDAMGWRYESTRGTKFLVVND